MAHSGHCVELMNFWTMGDDSDLAVELMNFWTASVTANVFRIPTGTGSPEPPSWASVIFSVSTFIFSVLESTSLSSALRHDLLPTLSRQTLTLAACLNYSTEIFASREGSPLPPKRVSVLQHTGTE